VDAVNAVVERPLHHVANIYVTHYTRSDPIRGSVVGKQDHDVLMLFDDSLDGIEGSGSDANQALSMVNLAPLDRFTPFEPEQARAVDRGH
jgi:hypothetical protein